MNETKRATARTKGLALAARIATVGGITAFALGVVEVRSARASATDSATDPRDESATAASDDTKPLPMEGQVQVRGGNCGCAPCWGPPAPPSKSSASPDQRGVG